MIAKRYIWHLVFALMVGIVSLLALVIRSDHPWTVRRQLEETPRPADLMSSKTTPVHLYFSDRTNTRSVCRMVQDIEKHQGKGTRLVLRRRGSEYTGARALVGVALSGVVASFHTW